MRTRLSSLAWLLVMAGCASKAPPPAQTPTPVPAPSGAAVAAKVPTLVEGTALPIAAAAAARSDLLASVAIPSLDRSLANAIGLAKQISPGVAAMNPREMLFQQMGLPPAVADALDTQAPIGVVFVSLGQGGDAGVAIAVRTKSAKATQQAIEGFGRAVARRGEAVQVEAPSGEKTWLWPTPDGFVLSDGDVALSRGARLAMEARRGGNEDVTAIIYPEAIARSRGTDVKTAVERMAHEMSAEGGGDISGMLSWIADADTAEVGLRVDPAQGVSAGVRLMARPGSGLEKEVRSIAPFVLDPALLDGGADRIGVLTMTFTERLFGRKDQVRATLIADKSAAGKKALAVVDGFLGAVSGQLSTGMQAQGGLRLDAVNGLKDAKTAAVLAKALGGLDEASAKALLKTMPAWGRLIDKGASLAFKKEKVGKLQAVHASLTLSPAPGSGYDAETMSRLLGGTKIELWAAVAGTRLVAVAGPDGKARLEHLAAGVRKEPDADLAAALAEARGREGFAYVDLAPVARLAATLQPQAMMLANLRGRIPLYVMWGGDGKGKMTSTDLRVPLAAFRNIGTFMQSLGMGGAPTN